MGNIMAWEPSNGLTEVSTRESGRTAERMERASSRELTALFMKGNGLTGSITGKASWLHQTARCMLAFLRMENT